MKMTDRVIDKENTLFVAAPAQFHRFLPHPADFHAVFSCLFA